MALRIGRSRTVRLLGLTAGVAAAATLLATAASATATWTVSAGSAASGSTVQITGKTKGATPQIHFSDATTSQTLTCDSGTAPGATKVGSGLGATALATINGPGTTWQNCSGPGGLTFSVAGIGTWNLNGLSYAAPVAKGKITKIKATVTDPGLCSFTVTGSVNMTYNNTSKSLVVPGKTAQLTISGVSGCFGLINNTDKASFKATYGIKANVTADNPIKITSP